MSTGTLTASSWSSGDMESFSDEVSRAYFPHALTMRGRPACPAELRAVDLGPVRLNMIGWGAEV